MKQKEGEKEKMKIRMLPLLLGAAGGIGVFLAMYSFFPERVIENPFPAIAVAIPVAFFMLGIGQLSDMI